MFDSIPSRPPYLCPSEGAAYAWVLSERCPETAPQHSSSNMLRSWSSWSRMNQCTRLSSGAHTSVLGVFYLFSFGIAKHFPFNTDNITRQPAHVTAKGILSATPAHYRRTHTLAGSLFSLSPLTPYAHISYIWITDYRYIIFQIFGHRLSRAKIWTELF